MMLARILAPIRRRRAKAARELAAARLQNAHDRRDSRDLHHAREALKAATTQLLRLELGRG